MAGGCGEADPIANAILAHKPPCRAPRVASSRVARSAPPPARSWQPRVAYAASDTAPCPRYR